MGSGFKNFLKRTNKFPPVSVCIITVGGVASIFALATWLLNFSQVVIVASALLGAFVGGFVLKKIW